MLHRFTLGALLALVVSPLAHGQFFGAGADVLPRVRYMDCPRELDALEVPRSSRLNLPTGEGTIEFWAKPSWLASGGASLRCIVANGRSVPRTSADGGVDTWFETRYAIYVGRNEIAFQSGPDLYRVPFSQFTGVFPFQGKATHFAVATQGEYTTLLIDGLAAVQIPTGYGNLSGSELSIGRMPDGARGRVRDPLKGDTLTAEDALDFGAFEGDLGGLRIWDKRLDNAALNFSGEGAASGSAPLLYYGELHAERDVAFDVSQSGGAAPIRRADLVAFSRFDHRAGPRVELADRIGGNWINVDQRRPRLGDVPQELREFGPMTVLEPYTLVSIVPAETGGGTPSVYWVLGNGDRVGTLERREFDGEAPYDLYDSSGARHEVRVVDDGDGLEISADVPGLGGAGGSFTKLIRNTARSTGNQVESKDVFLAGMRVADIDFSLRAYDLLELHPYRFHKGGEAVTGSDQWVFDKGHQSEWQLAFGANQLLPLGFLVDSGGESSGRTTGTTTTTEREVMNAVRAKFGMKAGKPKIMSGGVDIAYERSDEHKTASQSITTLGSSWAKWGTILLDPLLIRLNPEFEEAIYRLAQEPDFNSFIETWGTHYPQAVSHGAVLYTERNLDQTSVTKTSSWGLDVSNFVQVGESDDPALRAEASGGMSKREGVSQMLSLEESTWSGDGFSLVATEGGAVTAQIDKEAAIPVSMDLRLLHELLSPVYFDEPEIFIDLRGELRTQLLDYLEGDREPSDDPAVVVPPIRDSVTLCVKLHQIRYDADDAGSSHEFFGKITASAFKDRNARTPFVPGGVGTGTVCVWETSSDETWDVALDGESTSFGNATGLNDTFDAEKGPHSPLTGPGQLTYRLDVSKVYIEDFGVELALDLTEEDGWGNQSERFPDGKRMLQLTDFMNERGEFATSEYQETLTITIDADNEESDHIEVDLVLWAETESHPWINPSAKAQALLAQSLSQGGAAGGRARNANALVDVPSISDGDVLAYYPMDRDGLRRPGARWWPGSATLPDVDMDDCSLVFDVCPGDEHFAVTLDADPRGSRRRRRRALFLTHGSPRPDLSAEERDKDLGKLSLLCNGSWESKEVRLDHCASMHADLWYTVAVSLREESLDWVVIERDSSREVGRGTERLTNDAESPGRAELGTFRPLQWTDKPDQRARLDELYVFGRSLSMNELLRVARLPRAASEPLVRPAAYWPIDDKRTAAPVLHEFQGGLMRVLDDALVLGSTADTFEAPPVDMRDFTLCFDTRWTDSTRCVVLEDELGLFELRLFENADTGGLYAKLAEGSATWFLPDEIALTPMTGVQIADHHAPAYEWQRVALSFDGLTLRLAVDDGSGWVRQEAATISGPLRDWLAERLRAHGSRALRWNVRSEYHHPGTRRAAVAGYAPAETSERVLFDEFRIWHGAMDAGALAFLMRTPRRFAPPAHEPVVHGYFPLTRSTVSPIPADASFLEAICDLDMRGAQAGLIPGVKARQLADTELLALADSPVRFPIEDMPVSDFTLHLDFLPGPGGFELERGPVAIRCEGASVGARVVVSLDREKAQPLAFDATLGERLELGVWHKLVLAVDAWEAGLHVVLDGASVGRVPLDAASVAALRAADTIPSKWRLVGTGEAAASPEMCARVDELLFVSPALKPFDLEALARRPRENDGVLPPRRMLLAEGLTPRDPSRSALRASDESFADSVIAYFPFDGDTAERSGRAMDTAPAAAADPVEATFDGDALRVTGSQRWSVPGLDLEGYTLAAWFAVDEKHPELLSGPGVSLRISRAMDGLKEVVEEAARLGKIPEPLISVAMKDAEIAGAVLRAAAGAKGAQVELNALLDRRGLQHLKASARKLDLTKLSPFEAQGIAASLSLIVFMNGLHQPEIVLDSIDGRRLVAPLEFELEPRALHYSTRDTSELSRAIEQKFHAFRAGSWHQVVLIVDVAGGEVRGMWDGRRLRAVPLPDGFRLRSGTGSFSREVGVVPTSAAASGSRLDELIVLNGTPPLSSSVVRWLSSRPRAEGGPVEWTVREGFLLDGQIYELKSPGKVTDSTGRKRLRELLGRAIAVEGTPDRYRFHSRYNGSGEVWTTPPSGSDPRVVLGPGEALEWQLEPLGERDTFAVRCVSSGPWNGRYLTYSKRLEANTPDAWVIRLD